MAAIPPRQLNPTRTVKTLTIAWAFVGVALAIAVALTLLDDLGPVMALLVALFATISLGTLGLLAVWGRTRQTWAMLESDCTPEAYGMWTILGAVAGVLCALEGWVLTALVFFGGPSWLEVAILFLFLLPIVWAVVRLAGYRWRFRPPRGA